jgi:chromosome segregation ATPase
VSIQIESDLKEILQRFEQRFDKIDQKLDKLSEDVTDLKVGQARIEGEIKAVDERLSGQIKAVDERLSGQIKSVDERLSGKIDALEATVSGLDKRVSNQEFTNRGVLIGLIVVILGGAAKFFGIVGNP